MHCHIAVWINGGIHTLFVAVTEYPPIAPAQFQVIQLQYRYILSMEGYDVATNLKWIMFSNSLCMMRKPRFETWMMEGRLEAGVHYVELKDDHSDFAEKIAYYELNPVEVLRIIENAQNYMKQFFDEKIELITSLKVLDKYFESTDQKNIQLK
ncbi:hypothetical protein GJQ54_12555 [Oceanospirillaceae bacterium ASx5O]|nr:hypothetical protein GJQ54_12555 [Oceanospirillaceae bacterium ASx5O]